MRKLDSNAHSVFLLYYHLILVIKYRKKVLNDPISNRAREIFEHIAPNYHITLEEWNHDQDHVHIMFRAHPKSELSKFINAYKSASSLAVNLFVMIFVLYFMLIGGKKMEAYVNDILPFNEANTQEVIREINMIVRSNAIGIPLLAIIQGGVAMIGYLIFGAPNILLLGFLTCFATIIPMVGTALVWFPVAAYLAISGDWFHAIGLAAYGAIVVSQSDNLIRFILQKKMADTHPLITIFGVVIGLPLFGFMGVIFGPLLLSLFFLFVNMFKKEYLDLRNNLPSR